MAKNIFTKWRSNNKNKAWNSIIDEYCQSISYESLSNINKSKVSVSGKHVLKWLEKGKLLHLFNEQYIQKKALEFYFSAVVLSVEKNDRVLDAAGGRSDYLAALNTNGHFGESFLTDHIYLGVTRRSDGVNLVGGDIASIHLENESVDKVSCHHAFEHFQGEKDIAFLHEIFRILKPGGVLAITPLFIANKYVECWNICTDKVFDRQATKLIDKTASIPGGDEDGHFARIYDLNNFIRRIMQPAQVLGYECEVIECEIDGKTIPDMERNFGSSLNSPLRVLKMKKPE